MQVLITHLTRMRPGYICVAGLEEDRVDHVRPVSGRLRTSLLERNGGPFDLGNLVDLGDVVDVGEPPEVEDRQFEGIPRKVGEMVYEDFWGVVEALSMDSLAEIFGGALYRKSTTCVVDVGEGDASLGCLVPRMKPRPKLEIDEYRSLKLTFLDDQWRIRGAVTDLRLYETDGATPRTDRVEWTSTMLREGAPVLLAVGLTRPFRRSRDWEEYHWLQVNNIFLAEDPEWRDSDRPDRSE